MIPRLPCCHIPERLLNCGPTLTEPGPCGYLLRPCPVPYAFYTSSLRLPTSRFDHLVAHVSNPCPQAIHQKLTPTELVATFGVHQLEHVPEYDVIRPLRDTGLNGRPRLKFTAWNSTYLIELQPNNRLVSPHVVLQEPA